MCLCLCVNHFGGWEVSYFGLTRRQSQKKLSVRVHPFLFRYCFTNHPFSEKHWYFIILPLPGFRCWFWSIQNNSNRQFLPLAFELGFHENPNMLACWCWLMYKNGGCKRNSFWYRPIPSHNFLQLSAGHHADTHNHSQAKQTWVHLPLPNCHRHGLHYPRWWRIHLPEWQQRPCQWPQSAAHPWADLELANCHRPSLHSPR